ncbi:MAG: antitermination protein NusG [Planctomycetes bacterium]|nr:antitermination protein NusG [Planctomycetota bacterium]
MSSGTEVSEASIVTMVDVTATPVEATHPAPRVEAFTGRWWVLHTKARNEKAVAADLQRLSAQYFLPLVRCRRRYGGRIRDVDIPLFPGYVFLCGTPADRYHALRTHRVANVLEVGDQRRFVADLRQVQRVVESDEPVDLFPRLVAGCRCRVIAGSLVGLEGVVIRRRGPWRVYVGVEFLGQSAELEIDPSMLEVLD